MLTLQFIPYEEIQGLESEKRIVKILDVVKNNKIVLLQGRLKSAEETELIQRTMESINSKFKGIELCTIYPEAKDMQTLEKIRKGVVKVLLGNREGLTIVGPASIVKEIKKNPGKIELLTKEVRRKK